MDYQIKEVQRNCRYVEEDCEDAIQIAKLRLAELEEERKTFIPVCWHGWNDFLH